jgi:hypothetical protein
MQQKHDMDILENKMRGEVRITKQALLAKDQELMHRTEVLGVYRDKMTKLAESIEQLQQVMATYAPVFAAHDVEALFVELQDRVSALSADATPPPHKQQAEYEEEPNHDQQLSLQHDGSLDNGNSSSKTFSADDVASFIRSHQVQHQVQSGRVPYTAADTSPQHTAEDTYSLYASTINHEGSPTMSDMGYHSPSTSSHASPNNAVGGRVQDLNQGDKGDKGDKGAAARGRQQPDEQEGRGQQGGGQSEGSSRNLKAADMSTMFEYVYSICCTDGGKQTQNLSITQLLRFANRARIVDDKTTTAMVEEVFTSTVNASQRGARKFSKRITFDDFREVLVELAMMKFPQHSR